MPELHEKPKRNNYQWLWLLPAVIIVSGVTYYYFNYYPKNKPGASATVTGSLYNENNDPTTSESNRSGPLNSWGRIDFDSPDTAYAEVTDKNVAIKSDAQYVIYSLNSQNVFADNKSDLSNQGRQSLHQIGASINQRFQSDDIKIYDKSDTLPPGSIAEERAESVCNYLINDSKLNQSHVTFYYTSKPSSAASKSGTVNIVVKR
jgi:flagellar motor protein MotB